MRILVVNGSPKGNNSITLQTSLYLQKLHPEIEFTFLNAGSGIGKIEKDFSEARRLLLESEMIVFSYPVYTFIVPSQLHRFIELLKEHGVELAGKYATQISTSKHFYDVTAHRFIQENCQDLGMKYIKGLSADMEDLLSEKGRREAESFFSYALWCAANDVYEPIRIRNSTPVHKPVHSAAAIERKPGTVSIVADIGSDDTQLRVMTERFRSRIPYETKLINIREFPFKGGCISCFNCAGDGTCIYKDGFSAMLREQIQTCDAIVIAFSIRDHSMGARFKMYDDRQFCNGHRTVTMGMPFGYLVSGNYSEEENLHMIIEGRAEVGGNFLAGVATDEFDPDSEIDRLCAQLDHSIQTKYAPPQNFLGVGGMKIFRDLIWLMQGMMRADHKFYKAHGQYDFPQKKRGQMLAMYLVGALNNNSKLKAKMGSKMTEGMLMPYKKVLEKTK